MLTKEQVKASTIGEVFTLEEFINLNESGLIIPYDGNGYFHDGEKETNLSVWDSHLTWNDVKDFPYICWYNK